MNSNDIEIIEQFDIDQALQQNNKYCGQDIVFIETPISLNSAVNFSQHIYKYTRLFTLIGELHQITWNCTSPSLSIAEYSKDCVMKNPNCKIMLEYYYELDPERIDSHAIKTTFAALKNIGRTDAIIAYDPRVYFLGLQGQIDLYYNNGFNKYQTPQEIGQTFIEPYFQKLRENPHLFSLDNNYDPNIYNYLINSYVPDLTQSFYAIANMLQQNKPRIEIQFALMETWKKVTDFFVLKIILKNDMINEYVIILGSKHYENLNIVLKNMTYTIVQKNGSPQQCINLYKVCSFNLEE